MLDATPRHDPITPLSLLREIKAHDLGYAESLSDADLTRLAEQLNALARLVAKFSRSRVPTRRTNRSNQQQSLRFNQT